MKPRSDGVDTADDYHPRRTATLHGHDDAEQALLRAYRSQRMPHAWLIGGGAGIGKATLAYRAARFILAHPDPASSAVQSATTLAIDSGHPVFSRIAAQAHSDLLTLERTEGDNGKMRTVIAAEQVQRTVSFFGSTAGEGGWRICIVDSADEMNSTSANKILKILEEPPRRSLFFLISHSPGRLLPTIRSRCRMLALRNLPPSVLRQAVAGIAGLSDTDADLLAAVEAADGSAGRAMALLQGDTLALRRKINGLLDKLPNVDQSALHALGDALAGADPAPLATFLIAVREWLSQRLRTLPQEPRHLAPLAEVWDKINRAGQDVEGYNLERKPLVFAAFGLLAEAARR